MYGLYLKRHKRNCKQWMFEGGECWLFIMSPFVPFWFLLLWAYITYSNLREIKKKKRIGKTWEGGPSSCTEPEDLEELRVWLQPTELVLWKAWPPGSTCILLLTWATVVGVSVHTFQEGHSGQGWLPTATFGGRQTTAHRAGRERGWNEQFQWLTHPLLLSHLW